MEPTDEVTKPSASTAPAGPEPVADKKPSSPGAGGDRFRALRLKARKRGVGRGAGRPLKDDGPGADGEEADQERARKLPAPAPMAPADIAAVIVDPCRDALVGYRELGFFVTGHEHWKPPRPERMEAGARCMADILSKASPETRASIIAGLVWLRVLAVGYDVVGAPVVESYRVWSKRKEQEAAAVVEGDAKQ